MRVLVLGQSNFANHLPSPDQSLNARYFDWSSLDPSWLPVSDPLKGLSGTLGSIWPSFVDAVKLLDPSLEIDLIPYAVGGASIKDYGSGDANETLLMKMLPTLSAKNIVPDIVIYAQGEKDNILGTSTQIYLREIKKLIKFLQDAFPTAPIMVNTCTMHGYEIATDIQNAQRSVTDEHENVFLGIDFDQYGVFHRTDGTHLNEAGKVKIAYELAKRFLEICDSRNHRL